LSAIFLSHSSADSEAAEALRSWLENLGYRPVFLDFDPQQGIPAGRDWEKELYAELRAVIVLCSPHSMLRESEGQLKEHGEPLSKEERALISASVAADRLWWRIRNAAAAAGRRRRHHRRRSIRAVESPFGEGAARPRCGSATRDRGSVCPRSRR